MRMLAAGVVALLTAGQLWAQAPHFATESALTASDDAPLTPELAFQQGLMQFQAGDYESALPNLQAARSMGTAARYYEGLAASQLRRFETAVEAFASLEDAEGVPDGYLLEYGVVLVETGQVAAGIERLESHIVAFPEDTEAEDQLAVARQRQAEDSAMPSEFAGMPPVSRDTNHYEEMSDAERYLISQPDEEPRPWNLTLLNSIDWDSNVILSPEFSGLGSNRERADARHVIALFGDYAWIQEDDLLMGFFGTLFNSSQFQLNEFNTFNTSGGVYANKALSDSLLIGTNYQYQFTQVSGDTLASEHRLVLNGTFLEGEFGHLTTYYEYDRNRINAAALIPAQKRSANVHSVGVTQAIYLFEGEARAFVGYRFAENNAQGNDFDFLSHMVTGRVELPIFGGSLTADTIVDAEVRVFFDDYENPNSLDFRGRARDDTRTEVRAGIQHYLTELLSLRLDYTYVNSDSNVANLFGVRFYDYGRHVISTQLIYDF